MTASENLGRAFDDHWNKPGAKQGNGGKQPEGGEAPKLEIPPLETAATFVAGYQAPSYILDGVIQRNRLYTCTALTSHGKTAVGLAISVHLALERALGDRAVEPCRGIYLAAENPDDVRGRMLLIADKMDLDLEILPLSFVPGTFDLQSSIPRLEKEVQTWGEVDFVYVDTSPAFQVASGFDDENDNIKAFRFASILRKLTKLPGAPAVIANTHPTKNATKENLLPRGGGAFLNEVDGNLTLWADADRRTTELSWAGKLRGPSFEPITFALETGTCPTLVDHRGRRIPSVWARPTTQDVVEKIEAAAQDDEDALLIIMSEYKNGSFAQWAGLLGWHVGNGEPHKSRVHRALVQLKQDGLATQHRRGKYALTNKGSKEAKRLKDQAQ